MRLLEFIRDMLKVSLTSIDAGRDNSLKHRKGISDESAVDRHGVSSSEIRAQGETEEVADSYTLNMESYHLEILYQVHGVSVSLFQLVCPSS